MSIFVDRYLGRTRAMEHLVEDWKNKHDQAMFAMDVEEMVRECVDLAALCEHSWNSLWQLLRRDPNSDAVDDAAKVMTTALAKTLQVFRSVQDLVADAKTKGFEIKGSENLETAAIRVREINAKVETIDPPLNEEMAEEAIAAFKRGECLPIEELIREAQSGHLSVD